MTGQSTYRFSTSIDHEEDLDEPLITNFIFTAGTTSALTVTSLTINNLGYRFHFDDYFVTSSTINVYTSFTLSSATDILVNFSSVTITSDTKYVLSTEFYDDNSYLPNEEKGVILEIANGLDSENTIVSSLTYTTSTSSQTWVNLSLEFNTPSALTGTTNYVPVAKLYNKSAISASYKFYFDNFTITNYPLTPFTSFTFSSLTNSLLTLSAFTTEINKKYIISAKFFDDNSYNTGETKGVYIGFLPSLDSEHTIVSSLTYTTTTSSGVWNDLEYKFTVPSGFTGNTSYTVSVKIDGTSGITDNYNFFFDNLDFSTKVETSYTFTATSTNPAGTSSSSSASNVVSPTIVPGPPQNLSHAPDEIMRFQVYWNPPSYSGDSPLSHYILTVTEGQNPGGNNVYTNNNYTSTSFDSNTIGGNIEDYYIVYVTSVNTNSYQSSTVNITVYAQGP
jgi:hypothetical protein